MATMFKVALAPLAKLPMVQLGAVQLEVTGLKLTKVYPAGRISFTFTLVAALGPLLVAVIVKVTLVPSVGVSLLTVLVTLRSAAADGPGVTLLVLFPVLGSLVVVVMVAVLVYEPLAFTLASIVRVFVSPLFKVPIVQLGAAQLPEVVFAFTKVYPEGKTSFTTTLAALLGPLLVAVRVKITLVPTDGLLLFTDFTMATSADAAGPGVTVLLLLAGFGSDVVPLIVAVLA